MAKIIDKITPPALGLLCTLVGLFAPLYMLLLVWCIRWDAEPSYRPGKGPDDLDDPSYTVRGDLPAWARWAQTCDMRYPGGMYEPAMRAALGGGGRVRRLWAAYVWTGLRNRAQGLAYSFGKPAAGYVPDPHDSKPSNDRAGWTQAGSEWRFEREIDGVWQTRRWHLAYGWQVYRLADGSFYALPLLSTDRGG